MAEQLTYVLVNSYTLRKSRTGGILSRLLSRTALDLVAARLFIPSRELVREYVTALKDFNTDHSAHKRHVRNLIHNYILNHYLPDPITGRRHRVMMLLFKGENAVAKIRDCVGDVSPRSVTGESIRDTYGDYIVGENGEVKYFEPAVLAPQTEAEAIQTLKIWSKYSDKDGGLIHKPFIQKNERDNERTLVIIKPDNFTFPSGKPGNVMDMFSKAGLYIVGIKVNCMSVRQAQKFYAPVLPILRQKFKEIAGERARPVLENEFGFSLKSDSTSKIGEVMGPLYAEAQFEEIVKFMSGRKPSECSRSDLGKPGPVKSLVVVYEGENAVAKVREVLGPTDPRKAPPGSIRREFGKNIMVNAAHASDSPANAKREIKIVNVTENNFKTTIEKFLSKRNRK